MRKRSFIRLFALSTGIFRPPRRAMSRRVDNRVESLLWYAYVYANANLRYMYLRACIRAWESEWMHMYAGCGPPARLHYVYVVYDVRRPPQVCGRISPAVVAAKCVGVVSHMGLPPAAIFLRGWFYCPRTRASCWNSKWSSRRDVTPSVCEGLAKGEEEGWRLDDPLCADLRNVVDTRSWSCTRW